MRYVINEGNHTAVHLFVLSVYFDHFSVSHWVVKFLPMLEAFFRKHMRAVGDSWRIDATTSKSKSMKVLVLCS
jgi:transposase-like protein